MTTRGWMALLLCGGLFVFAATAVYAADKVEDTKLEDLKQQRDNALQERLVIAVRCRVATRVVYEAEQVDLSTMVDAINGVKVAKLAVTQGPARIDVLREHVKELRKYEAIAKRLYEVGTKGGEAAAHALVHRERLTAEIELFDEQMHQAARKRMQDSLKRPQKN